MKGKGALILFIMTLVFTCTTTVVLGEREREIRSLKGIKGLQVTVEDINPEAKRDGLTKEQIKTDVELKLRLSGIKVSDGILDPPLYVLLYVNVYIGLQPKINLYYFSIEVSIHQGARLVRNNNYNELLQTWDTHTIGVVHRDRMVKFVRNGINDLVDRFINDYLSVNPIQAPVKPTEPKK